jgi:pyrroline-5-carboxylate reductase
MPSLAIAVNDGVIGYTKAPAEVEKLLHGLGYAFEVPPEDIEKVTAFSGCGLGFAAYLIDAFKLAGEALGFSAEQAERIAAQTCKNAVERGAFAETVKKVATRGGATEQGVLLMDERKTYDIIAGAVNAAYDKMK